MLFEYAERYSQCTAQPGLLRRGSAVLVSALLSACAAAPGRRALEPSPPYVVAGSIGFVISPSVTPIIVGAPYDKNAAQLESEAQKQHKSALQGIWGIPLSIAAVPLVIFTPVYPPALMFPAFPFEIIGETAQASGNAKHLQEQADQTRKASAACGEGLAATYPELSGKFQRAFSGEVLHQIIQDEFRGELQEHPGLSIVPLVVPDEEISSIAVLREASQRHLPSVLAIEILSIELHTEYGNNNQGQCRVSYKVVGKVRFQLWDVEKKRLILKVGPWTDEEVKKSEDWVLLSRPGWPDEERNSPDDIDLPALVDRPEELRTEVAKMLRRAMHTTLNGLALTFANQDTAP